MQTPRYRKVSEEAVQIERSTCGYRTRIWKGDDGAPASVSRLTIDNAKPHYHLKTHEYYYILEGTGALIIDGERVPVKPGDSVWIKPGAVHHAEGDHLESLVIGIPPFDANDQYFPDGVVFTAEDRH
jgi:mannose-6-phosphate isomerase-like protein (cupin superfamily)